MNTEPLTHIPPEMNPWGLQLITPEPSEFGAFHLIGCEQASIETHHQVEVIDEDGKPMRGVVVIFGYPSGPNINMPTRVNHWRDAPTVLRGNAQRTNAMGYAQRELPNAKSVGFPVSTNPMGCPPALTSRGSHASIFNEALESRSCSVPQPTQTQNL